MIEVLEPDLFELTPEENWELPDKALIDITWVDNHPNTITVGKKSGRHPSCMELGHTKDICEFNLIHSEWLVPSTCRVGGARMVKIIRYFKFG